MKNQPETLIKRGIFEYLNAQPEYFGWVAANGGIYDPVRKMFRRHQGTGQRKGVPDLVGMWGPQMFCVEVKSPVGRVSPEQRYIHEQIEARGGLILVARSVEDVITFVCSLRIVMKKNENEMLKMADIAYSRSRGKKNGH